MKSSCHVQKKQPMHLGKWVGATLLSLSAGMVSAHHSPDHDSGDTKQKQAVSAMNVQLSKCWVRLLPGKLPAAAYFMLSNQGKHSVTLMDASSSAYGHVMLHKTSIVDGVASMAHIDAVDVAAGQSLAFVPGSYHVMLEQPVKALNPGETITLDLGFANGGHASATCDVKSAAR